MDEHEINNTTPTLEPEREFSSSADNKPKVTSKIFREKPLIEGINSPMPMGNPKGMSLTTSERRLINDAEAPQGPRIKTEQPLGIWQPEGVPSWKKVVGWLVTVVVVVVAGVGGYIWFSRSVKKNDTVTVKTVPSAKNNNQQTTPALAQNTDNSVLPTSTPPSVVATSTPTPPVAVKQLKVSETPTGFLNVRSAPSTSGKMVTQIHPGEIYTYDQEKGGWYHISLPDGLEGWVIGTYVTTMQPK